MKRLLDLLVALTALLVIALPMAFVMLILRLTGEGKVFFLQERVGHEGRHFRVFKFVTMREDSETTGTRDITLRGDSRVLPVGRVLRMTKLNELPQVLNIVRGDMTLVGWRPLVPSGFADYQPDIQDRITKTKPGLTGMGSLAFRDEEAIMSLAERRGKDPRACYRDDIMPYKGALELWYQEHMSLILDLKILVATGLSVILPGSRHLFAWFRGLPVPESDLLCEVFRLERSAAQTSTSPS